MAWFNRLSGGRKPPVGKASSFHVWWDAPQPAVEVSVVLEVVRRPQIEELFFWALQVSFDGGAGAHIGLQHHPGYPSNAAVNWGGYDSAGTILEGSESPLPSALGNRNTRSYEWRTGAPYRLTVRRGDNGWDGIVTDLQRDQATRVRTLFAPSGALHSAVVWSEVFAACEEADSSVRWSDFRVVGEDDREHDIRAGKLTYQRDGCANTNSGPDDGGVIQTTGTRRVERDGQTITW